MSKTARYISSALVVAGIVSQWGTQTVSQASDPCTGPTANPVSCENTLPGNPASEWDITGAGDPSIQGFATDSSVNRGGTIRFKIDTPASSFRVDIYRLGYYGGLGARKVTTFTVNTPQTQPACLTDAATGLVDCGLWGESASWAVPATAVSGIYVAKLVRTDATPGDSHIVFVVRDDAGQSDLLFQTSDTTWQAYNSYGGNSLYAGSPAGRAYKVSYNRPYNTRASYPEDWVFNAEYPMVRWLEANGYDVGYASGIDTDRSGTELLEHKVFLSVGHDEYWSGAQRTAVESARAAGVHLAFFSGNEVFWKTRYEPSIDGSATPYRTLVSYKETHANAKIDPLSDVWTGTWRDARFSPPADGGRPENALTGQLFMVNAGTMAIEVPAAFGALRFWRNTSVASLAPGTTAVLSPATLGYEWDEAPADGAQPAGLVRLSRTTGSVSKLLDQGSTYGPGTATHSLTFYRDQGSDALVFGAGTVQWSWGLDAVHDRGTSLPDLRMQQATVNLLADMSALPVTPATNLVVSAGSTDTLAPTSVVTAPAPGATLVQAKAATISGTASDAGGGTVAAVEVSVDGGSNWALASGTTAWTFTWTPTSIGQATLLSRALDDSGNLETAAGGVTVTVSAPLPAVCPCTVWPDTAMPAVEDAGPDSPVELGVKFRSDSNGYITGLRFYKSAANTGTHVGSLWTAGGALLARVTFINETASGWQTETLPTPVAVTANTTYVASYHATTGHYAFSPAYFSTGGADNAPLHAVPTTVSPNGVFRYGASSVFPTDSYNDANYWVDLVFATTVVDTSAPLITATVPGTGATAVAPPAQVTVSFNEPMDPVTIGASTYEVRTSGGSLVAGTVTYDDATRRAVFTPAAAFAYNASFTATLRGGATTPRVTDLAGNALASTHTWSFTTSAAPPPPPDQGPGGPILVVSTPSNPFTRYYAEILRAEGLNAFAVADLSTVTATTLSSYDVVVLGEMPLTAADVTMFTTWVTGGGRLIAMRPDKQLASLIGVADAAATLSDQYLLMNTASGPGAGLVDETIQFHGAADLYTLAGATSIATLYSSATTPTARPAVTLRAVGSNGGQVAAFTYDLAKSIVYTRQGNPAWAGQDRDGLAPIRSNDLFFGGALPDWVDLNKVLIPQADEQQRLLANLVLQMNSAKKPLPRFWYLPRSLKAVVIMTGDDHANGGSTGRFEQYLAASRTDCSLDDWECLRGTSYIYPNTPIDDSTAAAYRALGFELGLHVTTNCVDYTPTSLANSYTSQLAAWRAKYTSLPSPVTNRTHCIAWSDYATQPQVAFSNGIRLDTNYYYWPSTWLLDRPGMFTGSGMPMRFATSAGAMIDVYQAATQLTDESGLTYALHINTLLDNALGPDGYYGAFTANMHTDQVYSAGSDAIMASAIARNVPMISAAQMLQWLDGRNASTFRNMTFSGTTLTFTIEMGAGARGLRTLLPYQSGGASLVSLSAGGSPISYVRETIKGVEYATFQATAATYQAVYDPGAPETTITSSPAASSGSSSASFQFTSSLAGGTFQCALDGAAYAACTTPKAYTSLAEGAHTFAVRAVSASGVPDPSPATYTWSVSAVAPDTTITSAPAAVASSTTATFQFTSTLAGSTFQCARDGAAYATCVSPLTYAGLAQGDHTFSVRAVSATGVVDATPATFAWRVDTVAPVMSAVSVSVTTTTAVITWTTSELADSVVDYALTSAGPFTRVSNATMLTAHSLTLSGLTQGTAYVYRITSRDAAGLSGYAPSATGYSPFTTTVAVPNTTITATPAAASSTTSATFQFTSTIAGSTFQCSRDGAAYSTCATPLTYTGLSQGSHTFSVRAVSAGVTDPTPATFGWTIDTSAPIVSGVTVAPGLTSATITFATNEVSDTQIDFGTSSSSLTQRVTNGSMVLNHSATLTGLTAGVTYYYRITTRNAAGLATASPSASGASLFVTRTQVSQAPGSVTVTTGSTRSGSASSLADNDGSFYRVNSTTSGSSRTATWYGSFSGVTNSLANLSVTYAGLNTLSATQVIEIYNWSTNGWVSLNSKTVSTTEITTSGLLPSGAAGNYVSGTSGNGEVRVRIRTTAGSSSFYTSGDQMRISFDRP